MILLAIASNYSRYQIISGLYQHNNARKIEFQRWSSPCQIYVDQTCLWKTIDKVSGTSWSKKLVIIAGIHQINKISSPSGSRNTWRMIFSGAWYASKKWQTLTKAHCLLELSSRLRWFQPNFMSSLRWWTRSFCRYFKSNVASCRSSILSGSSYSALTYKGDRNLQNIPQRLTNISMKNM